MALNSVDALEPTERGLVFLLTLALLSAVRYQIKEHYDRFSENASTAVPLYWSILGKLLEYLIQIVLSLFSTGAGRYVSTVMGGSIVDQPVYSLTITSIIVAVLYLVKEALTGKLQ